jgi:hypothetical protein
MKKGAATGLLLLAACVPVIESMRTTPVPLEPRPADHAVRLYTATRPRCPYEEIGLLTAEDTGLMRYALLSDQTADLLRARVRTLGGDAIVGLGEVIQDDGITTTHTVSQSTTADTTGSASSVQVKTDVTPNYTRRLRGLVVRFTREGCRE